ncbi:MAG TPA: hypothetical protein VHF90_08395 [Thermoleophilaceae bacterium]|nr:hypothetical protein [Thermoleophilaceae bacterium]
MICFITLPGTAAVWATGSATAGTPTTATVAATATTVIGPATRRRLKRLDNIKGFLSIERAARTQFAPVETTIN